MCFPERSEKDTQFQAWIGFKTAFAYLNNTVESQDFILGTLCLSHATSSGIPLVSSVFLDLSFMARH